MRLLSNGNVLIDTTIDRGYKLYVSGNIKSTAIKTNTVCIECGETGETGSYGGEINRFEGNLYLQNRQGTLYLSYTDGSTVIRSAATIGGAYDLAGSTYKLYVNGDSYVNGELKVAGRSVFSSAMTCESNLYVNKSLTVSEDASLGSTLKVTGATTLLDKLTISKNGMSVTGAAYFGGGTTYYFGSTGNVSANTLTAAGATTLKSTLSVAGASTFTGNATFRNKIYLSDDVYIYWDSSYNAIRTNASFASDKTVSSLGVGSDEGGGGSADWGAVPTNIIPAVNGGYNLGSASSHWSKLYVARIENSDDDLYLNSGGYIRMLTDVVFGNNDNHYISPTGIAYLGNIYSNGNIVATLDAVYDFVESSLSGYATQSWVNTKLGGYATQTSIPTKVSQLTNDSKFITDGVSSFKVGTYDGLSVAGTYLGAGSIVVKESAPSIKFLVKSYTSNYTSIIEEATANVLNINGQVYAKKDGNVAIGTSTINNSYKLYVNGATYFKGNSYVSGTFTATNNAQFRGAYIADSNLTGGYDGSTVWSVTPEGAASFKSLTVNGVAITGNGGGSFNGGTISGDTIFGSIGSNYQDTYKVYINGALCVEDLIDAFGGLAGNGWEIMDTGDAYFQSIDQASDLTIKSIIKDVRLSLGTMANAPLVQFDWTNRTNKKHHVGTIAQYWEGCLPEVVSRTKDGTLALAYGELGVAMGISLANILEDTNGRVATVEEEIKTLKEENKRLKERVAELEAA